MKTAKQILLVALMLGTLIGYAKDNKIATYDNVDDNVKIVFKSVKKGQALTIQNENGEILYKAKIKNSGNYAQTFDFTNLEDGLYTTVLKKDSESIIKKIKIKNGKVSFLDDAKKKIFKPTIRTKDNLVLISKIAFNKAPVYVSLYYKGDLIHSETLKGDEIVNRVYKLSEQEKGDYKVVINTDNKVYNKNFSI
ncbi:hypothetical protein [Polaribacter sargassicola]|uniref:hypothetical protein n=1 Tax=Polaribacter sargassicola TaxID=2836891 RepID=UPI001F43B0FB|nr:hypothetical protein [Polaribacter sp. DS7-9]MCG1034900.1 hypothetical protein [Polaribacter sp. DS7-9]